MANYDATNSFFSNLKEVDTLVKLIKENENNSLIYSSLLKSSIVLMTAYFEVFIEEIIEEFITELNNNNLNSSVIPEGIKKFQADYIKQRVEIENPVKNRNEGYEKELYQKSLIYLIDNWSSENIKLDILNSEIEYRDRNNARQVQQIAPINKFNYGSHGSKELNKILKRVGLNSLESSYSTRFNEIVSKRNSIVHSGTILGVTLRDIRIYLIDLKKGSKKLDDLLYGHLKNIINQN